MTGLVTVGGVNTKTRMRIVSGALVLMLIVVAIAAAVGS
jgi:hypothetical protein